MTARVAPNEHSLLLIARAVVGQVPRAAVEPLIQLPHPRPARIRPTASRLLRQTLAAGAVREIMRRGGWRRQAALEGDGVVVGRSWERTPPLRLCFSPLSYHLCAWLVGSGLAAPETVTDLPAIHPTLGDEILLYLAHDLLGPLPTSPLARQFAVRRSPLCCLAFPGDLGPSEPQVPLEPWLREGGAVVVAALVPDLARHWVELARRHRRGPSADATGALHDAIAGAFLRAADAIGRRDLAQFVVDAGAAILTTLAAPPNPPPLGQAPPHAVAERLAPDLGPGATLAARAGARRAAGAPLRALLHVGRWHDEHKLVRHFDDGYASAQHLLRRWEAYAHLFTMAEATLRALDALDAGLPGAPPGDPVEKRAPPGDPVEKRAPPGDPVEKRAPPGDPVEKRAPPGDAVARGAF